MKMCNNRNHHRLLAALLIVIMMLALCPHITVNAATAVGTTTANGTNADGTTTANGTTANGEHYDTYGPVSLGAYIMLKAIHDTGDTPTEEENRGWVVLVDVTDSITAEKRMEVDNLVRELQLEYPKIEVIPFSNKLLLDDPYYEGMEMAGYATNIVDSYEEVATKYDHIILITDGYQEERYNRPFKVQHHKDVWIYQVGEYSREVEKFFDRLTYAMRGDCSCNLYRADGTHVECWNEYPYEKVGNEDSSLEPIQQPVVDPILDETTEVVESETLPARTLSDIIWYGINTGWWWLVALMIFILAVFLIVAVVLVLRQLISCIAPHTTNSTNEHGNVSINFGNVSTHDNGCQKAGKGMCDGKCAKCNMGASGEGASGIGASEEEKEPISVRTNNETTT